MEYPVTILRAPDSSLQSDFQRYEQDKKLTRPGSERLSYEYMLAGPTCDSVDKMFLYQTDKEIRIGDRLLFENTGAYGYSLECDFNGYRAPAIEVISNQIVSILPNVNLDHTPEMVLLSEPC